MTLHPEHINKHGWSGLFEEALSTDGAKVIAIDLLLSEKQESITLDPIINLSAAFKAENNEESRRLATRLDEVVRTVGNFDEWLNPDKRLSAAIKKAGNVLVPYSFDFTRNKGGFGGTSEPLHDELQASAFQVTRYVNGQQPDLSLSPHKILQPVSMIAKNARALGHVNVGTDADGTARYGYPVIAYDGEFYPSLSLQAVRVFRDFPPEAMRIDFNEGIQLGDIWVSTDDSMRLVTNFYGPNKTFPIFSFVDVLEGRVPKSAFAGKIVMLGASAIGVVDNFVTPFSGALSGTERMATVVENILHQESLTRRDIFWVFELVIAVAGGVILGWASSHLSYFKFGFLALGLGLVYAAVNTLLLGYGNIWLNLMLPLVTWVITYSIVMIFRFFVQERDARELRAAFGKYLDPNIVKLLCENPSMLKLGGEKKELTVLFSDIRDFSTISENLPPEDLVILMNEYLSVMSAIVVESGGLVDKYIGDSVMAVFGAPYPSKNHAEQACDAAVRMIKAAEKLRAKWNAVGNVDLRIGIGINTGDMVIGNMGSDDHFNYTAMGDEVNVAARLEQANKAYGTGILISKETCELVRRNFAVRELDECVVKGRRNAVLVYELLNRGGLDEERAEGVRMFELGLDHYRNHLWQKAIDVLEQARENLHGDSSSDLFIYRCKQFIQFPPAEDWDGYVRDSSVTSVTRVNQLMPPEDLRKESFQSGVDPKEVIQLGKRA